MVGDCGYPGRSLFAGLYPQNVVFRLSVLGLQLIGTTIKVSTFYLKLDKFLMKKI